MIFQKEIIEIAGQAGVRTSVVDKDWVLGHFIAAMFSEPDIQQNLIFKGGTSLRKCWFPDYRFSEDLDFTAKSADFEFSGVHQLINPNKLQIVRKAWDNSLKHQIRRGGLPEFELVIDHLKGLLEDIFR